MLFNTEHGGYRWTIMLEKCGHPDLNFFTSNELSAPIAIKKNHNPEGCFGATS